MYLDHLSLGLPSSRLKESIQHKWKQKEMKYNQWNDDVDHMIHQIWWLKCHLWSYQIVYPEDGILPLPLVAPLILSMMMWIIWSISYDDKFDLWSYQIVYSEDGILPLPQVVPLPMVMWIIWSTRYDAQNDICDHNRLLILVSTSASSCSTILSMMMWIIWSTNDD